MKTKTISETHNLQQTMNHILIQPRYEIIMRCTKEKSSDSHQLLNTLPSDFQKIKKHSGMKRIISLLMMILCLTQFQALSQSILIKADTIIASPGDSVTVSVRASNLPQIGSLTLFIQYDQMVLDFGRATNINVSLLAGTPLINKSGNKIIVSWADINGATIGSNKLFDLRFKFNGGGSAIQFLQGCEVTDILGNNLIPAPSLVNGRVMEPLSVTITSNNDFICLGDSMQLKAQTSSGLGNNTYSWSSVPVGFISSQPNVWVKPIVNTTYSVTVNDGVYSDSDSKLISIFNSPQPASVTNMIPANNAINLNPPVTFSWAPAAYASSYDFYLWKATQTKPLTPTKADLTSISYQLQGQLTMGTTYKWQIVSKNLCARTEGQIQQFTTRHLPDLHVTQITLSPAYAGQSLTVSWTVKNDGLGSTAGTNWIDHIWLSPDIEVRAYDPSDIMLNQFSNVSYLEAGQSYTNTQQVTLPQSITGSYYIFVSSDAVDALFIDWSPTGNGPLNAPVPYTPSVTGTPYRYIQGWHHDSKALWEVSDSGQYCDNFFYKQIDVIMPPVPDLKPTQIIAPNNAFSGQQINLNFNIKNTGYATATGTWEDALYLCPDTSFIPATAVLLGTYQRSTPLQPDSAYGKSVTVTIPPNILGTYYLFLKTDATNTVFENVYENNNTFRSAPFQIFLTPPSDLVVQSVQSIDSVSTKDIFNLSWTVKNQGATATGSLNWIDSLFMTTASNFDLTNAFKLGSSNYAGNLLPDSSYNKQMQVIIPPNISGQYYFYVKTDATNNVFEYTSDNNNTGKRTNPVKIQTPDLVVKSLTIPASESNGQAVSLSWVIKNNGPGKLINGQITDNIYISKKSTFYPDSVILTSTHTYNISLLKNDTIALQKSVLLPQNISGIYYIYIYTDYTNTVFEATLEGNNTLRSTGTINIIKPDLTNNTMVLPSELNSGQADVLSWFEKNAGPGNIQNATWISKILLSKYGTYHPDSVKVAGIYTFNNTSMNAGDSLNINTSFVTPNLSSGNYYIYLFSDAKDTVYEGIKENNNIIRSSVTIPLKNPNLVVSSIAYPSSSNSGQPINVQWKVKNQGPGKLYYSSLTDKIYLSQSQTFNPDSAILIGSHTYNATILPGDSLNNQLSVTIPNGTSGVYYVFVHINQNQTVYEGGLTSDNRNKGSQITISLTPWADLRMMSISAPDSITSGENMSFLFTVKNSGTASTGLTSWTDKIYISTLPDFDTSATLLTTFVKNLKLDTGQTYQTNFSTIVSSTISTGYYYIYAITDVNNQIYEYNFENNNIIRSNPVFVRPYPINMRVTAFLAPDSAFSGTNINIQYSVINNSTKPTLPQYWYDAVYLSTDTIWNYNSDIKLKEWKQNGPLPASLTYSSSQTVQVPNGIQGNYYLIVVCDYNNTNEEMNHEDNVCVYRKTVLPSIFKIKLTPSPDLKVKLFTAPLQCASGQQIKVVFRVKNEGIGATNGSGWTDKVYLSSDFTINQGDAHIGTYNRTANLDTGQFYTDSLMVEIPVSASGNMILIFKTDFNNIVFENNQEDNNIATAFIVAVQPPPADLIVQNITIPDSSKSGKPINISWTVKNIGPNPAIGNMKDMVYLSSDTIWDIQDRFLGEKTTSISLPSLGTTTQSINPKLPGVIVDKYYVIVRTDLLNNIFESNDTNNTGRSANRVFADMQHLDFNSLRHDTLLNLTDLYYLIDVPDSLKGESMLATLKADSLNGSNEMYLKKDLLSTRLLYDYTHLYPYQGNQELLVPYLFKGPYYLLLYGKTSVSSLQTITLKPQILDFEVRSIQANYGGNTGITTVLLTGSKFTPYMKVSLIKGNDTIRADTLIFINFTKAYVRFNLKDKTVGMYKMQVHHFCEGTLEIPNAFEVKSGTPNYLSINVVHPANARANKVTSFTIEYANLGNTDLIAPSIDIVSQAGAPIALDASGLSSNSTQLHIPLQIPGEPYNVLRPGVTGSIIIYTRTTAGLGFTISIPTY